jgi:hypothetical protein
MTTYLWRVMLNTVVCLALSFSLCAAAEPQVGPKSGTIPGTGLTSGDAVAIVVGVIAVVVIVAVVVIHSKAGNRTITGCVNAGAGGMTLTNESDKRSYLLAGETAGIKPGDRMSLQGKSVKPHGSTTFTLETKKIKQDYGVCPQ